MLRYLFSGDERPTPGNPEEQEWLGGTMLCMVRVAALASLALSASHGLAAQSLLNHPAELPQAPAVTLTDDDAGYLPPIARTWTAPAPPMLDPGDLPVSAVANIVDDDPGFAPPVPWPQTIALWYADPADGQASMPDDDAGWQPPARWAAAVIWPSPAWDDAAPQFSAPAPLADDDAGFLPPRPWPVTAAAPVVDATDLVVPQPAPFVEDDAGFVPPRPWATAMVVAIADPGDTLFWRIEDDPGFRPPVLPSPWAPVVVRSEDFPVLTGATLLALTATDFSGPRYLGTDFSGPQYRGQDSH